MCLPRTEACAIYGAEKCEKVPYNGYRVTHTALPRFGCETRSLGNLLVLSAHQIFNPDMSCLNYSGAHKPFIRIRGEIFGLICKSHISKDLGGSFSIPSRKVTGLVCRGPGFGELMTSIRGYFHDFPRARTWLLLHVAHAAPFLLPNHPSASPPPPKKRTSKHKHSPYISWPKTLQPLFNIRPGAYSFFGQAALGKALQIVVLLVEGR